MKSAKFHAMTGVALTALVGIATGCGGAANTAPIYPLQEGVTMGGAGCINAQAALSTQGYSLNFSGNNNIYDGQELLAGYISSLDSPNNPGSSQGPNGVCSKTLTGNTCGMTVGGGKFAGQGFGTLNITGKGNAGGAAAGMLSGSGPDGQIMVNLQGFDNTAGSYGTAGQKLNITGSIILSAQKLSEIAAAMGWNAGAGVYSSSGPQPSMAQELCFSGAALSLGANINNTAGSQVFGRFYLYPTSLGSVVAAGSNPTSQPVILQF